MSSSSPARQRAVRRVLLIELALNLLVSALKGAFGLWSGSLAITSDAVHSLVDAGANVVGLIVLGLSGAPPDVRHPYGHRKIEVIGAALLGVAVAAAAVQLGWTAIAALIAGRATPTLSIVGFAVIGGTLAINIFVATYEARRARELESVYLAADAAHTASDVLVTTAVLMSYGAAYMGLAWADSIGALLVIVVIARVAWGVLSTNVATLVDAAVLDAAAVAAVARAVPGVSDVHRIRSRGPAGAVHLDLHLLMDGDLSLTDAHGIAHRAEAALREAFPSLIDLTVHMEPDDDDPEGL